MQSLTLCRFTVALILSGLLIAFFQACQPTTAPQSPGYDYYPLQSNRYWEYEVTEQQYFLNGTSTTETYQWREVMTAAYSASAQDTTYRIERYRRTGDGQSWQPDSVSRVELLNDQLLKTENNLSYVKLTFPVTERAQWDSNAFNSLGKDDYQFRNTGQPFTVLNQTFPATATVLQQNDSTLVNQDKRLEVYARQVGLIYREKVLLQFCSSTPSCVGTGKIDYGTRQYVRLKAYGKL